jgi:Flp pilus assembly protein TadD
VRLLLALVIGALVGCAAFAGHRHFEAGNAALDRGDAATAAAEYERAAALVPEASEVQNHLGLAYAALGRAVALDCDNRAAVENLDAARARAALDAR